MGATTPLGTEARTWRWPHFRLVPLVLLSVGLLLGLLLGRAAFPNHAPTGAEQLTLNLEAYPKATVYWNRELWAAAVQGEMVTEDFERDGMSQQPLTFPYLTERGLVLHGESKVTMQRSGLPLLAGTSLHVQQLNQDLVVQFPAGRAIAAFGFDYKAAQPWQLTVNNTSITFPKSGVAFGGVAFVGVILHDLYPRSVVLSGNDADEGGLTLDNLTFVYAPK
ncbi:MAG: hypothetical protein MUD01_00510 [Chloroflexaceae bacterium]|nr:hypothetical protein [Chloroflexaceae bacterium]